MTHTPGPWRAEGGAIKAISHGQYFTVALVDKKRFTPTGRETNARLIAAAPDLLAALQGLIAHIPEALKQLDRYPEPTVTDDLFHAEVIARVAIARATGDAA